MATLFNQTNLSPTVSFAAGGGGGGGSNLGNATADNITGNSYVQNGVNYQSPNGLMYNSQGTHNFGYQNVNPVDNSAARWTIDTNGQNISYNTGIAGAQVINFNLPTVDFSLNKLSTITNNGAAGSINIIALASTLQSVYPGCVG